MDQLIEYPTEKEMKLQRYIQSLHQELQVAHQSKVSLQEALTETNKQGSTFDGNNLVFMNEKLEDALQEKQILTEDIEKLRAAVAYNEVYITELEEEKKQLEEEKRQLEEQLMEKQITKGTGMADPVALNTHRARRNLTVPVSPSKNPTTYSSSSTTITEATALSTGGASISATVDVNKVKNVIDDVLVSHYADLTSLPIEAVPDLANQLFALRLVNNAVKDNPSIKKCIDEFKASLKFMRKLPQVEEHCQKFLSSFIAVRGSYANAAIALGEGWIEAIRNELRFDFNINIDT
ncbi:PREDICTED: uncharacterized protein LOC109591480 [Amphimedon queenslandica]|nr:PREDICTED: uncharacterized protein LOC109591480 [Amphimedon queenslandica]|eukprot:XP_019862766.1 PREDICTED: uncharacterized protein LOC109591480 [Amphimedon queenslandica]